MNFRTWVDDQHHAMAAQYRTRLGWIASECERLAHGNDWKQEHTDIALELLRDVKPPTIPMYPGTVSEADKAWYLACRKPQWNDILAEYEGRVMKLTAPATDTRKK